MNRWLIVLFSVAALLGVWVLSSAQTAGTTPGLDVTVAVTGIAKASYVEGLATKVAALDGVYKATGTAGADLVTARNGEPAPPAMTTITARIDDAKCTPTALVAFVSSLPTDAPAEGKYKARLLLNVAQAKARSADVALTDAEKTRVQEVLKGIKGVSGVALDASGHVATVDLAATPAVTTRAIGGALGHARPSFMVSFAGKVSDFSRYTAPGCAQSRACHGK